LERPLEELATESDAHTVLIIAEPGRANMESGRPAVASFLQHGGRVLATGLAAASLLPGNQAEPNPQIISSDCTAQPEGFAPLAGSASFTSAPLHAGAGTFPISTPSTSATVAP